MIAWVRQLGSLAEVPGADVILRGVWRTGLWLAGLGVLVAFVGLAFRPQVFEVQTARVERGSLVEIGDLRELEIVVDVLSSDAVRIEPGCRVWLEQWGGAAPLVARVRQVEPAAFTRISALGVEEQRVNVIGEFDEDCDTSRIGDGYRVEAAIVTWSGPDVLRVPAGALFREAGRWSVFRIRGGLAEPVEVGTGHRTDTAVEVLAGLEEEDEVVLYPGDQVRPGVRVRVSQR